MAIFMDLLSTADVFVNGVRDKALKRMGLDYETLHEKFPRLIWAQMRGYGEFGEMRDEPGYDAVCWGSRGGVMRYFARRANRLRQHRKVLAISTQQQFLRVVS